MYLLFSFIFGLFMGSFLHVVGYRAPKGTYFSSQRSACPQCQHTLSWYELFPLLSFIFQKGRCSSCKMKIPIIYPLSELICGLLFSLIAFKFSYSSDFFYGLLFVSILFVLSVCDFYYYILPNPLLICLSIIVVLWRYVAGGLTLQESLFASLFSILVIGLLIYISKGGMGMGDFKLLFILAYFFGFYPYLQLLMLASLLALLFVISQKIVGKQKQSYIYFGPFISIAACILLFLA